MSHILLGRVFIRDAGGALPHGKRYQGCFIAADGIYGEPREVPKNDKGYEEDEIWEAQIVLVKRLSHGEKAKGYGTGDVLTNGMLVDPKGLETKRSPPVSADDERCKICGHFKEDHQEKGCDD